MAVKISIVAPTIRPHLWKELYDSCLQNTLEWEIVFVGPGDWNYMVPGPNFRYIQSPTKPAQCYEIGFRAAQGELLHWSTDDCTYAPQALDNVYKYYKELDTEKQIIAIRPNEDGREITNHTFKGGNTTPMAPFGVMSTRLFHELGGYDKQFICGQSENDVVMRVFEIGGVYRYCPSSMVLVCHNKGHGGTSVFRGGVDDKPGFYGEDRKVLEPLWITDAGMKILTGVKASDDLVNWADFMRKTRSRPVDRFDDKDLQTVTQGPKGIW